jgi:thiamine-phosphate pyrophosphorylase
MDHELRKRGTGRHVRLPDPPLLVITDRAQAHAPLDDVLAAAFAAGCRWASVREKDLPPNQQVALAQRLHRIARDWDAYLTLHGEPALASAARLDGVHLAAGGDPAAARKLLGAHALIGISLHSEAEAGKLNPAVVDYAIAGPAYASASKPEYGPVLGMLGIGRITDATKVPIIAIGGITADAVAEMHVAGAAGVAVMGGVMRAMNPRHEVRRLVEALSASL